MDAPKIKNPLYQVLQHMTGKKPPLVLENCLSFSEISDEEYLLLQDWVCNNSKPYWVTGEGILEAAQIIVNLALENNNIRLEKD